MRGLGWIGLVLMAVGLAPVIVAFASIAIADWAGCTLHEGYTNPCIIGGTDWGETLYSGFVLGWLGLVSLPIAAVGLILFVVSLVGRLIRRR